jgi:hypothetical protein
MPKAKNTWPVVTNKKGKPQELAVVGTEPIEFKKRLVSKLSSKYIVSTLTSLRLSLLNLTTPQSPQFTFRSSLIYGRIIVVYQP